MLMPCKEWNERLSAWLDGEGTVTERKAVEDHLSACPACRAAAEVLRCDAQDAMAELRSRKASDGFAARVMGEVGVTKMDEPEAAPARRSHPWIGWLVRLNRGQLIALMGATASVVLLVVVVGTNLENAGLMPFQRKGANYPPAITVPNNSLGYLQNGPATTDVTAQQPKTAYEPRQATGERMRSGPSVEGKPTPVHTSTTTPPPAGKLSPIPHPPPSEPTIIPPELNYGLVDKLMIAYTAEMALRTKTVNKAMERAELLFQKYDGFVLNTQYNRDEKGKATATVNGRVPAGKLGQLLVELDGLGELRARTVNGEDLTAKQLEQIEKLGDLALKQQFLSKIEGRDNRYAVEQQREAAREKGTGLRVEEYKLKNRVTLASVTVKISSPPKPKPDPVKQSASKSFRGLRAFGMWMLTVLIIPLGIWLPVWGPLAVLGIVLRRRYRR